MKEQEKFGERAARMIRIPQIHRSLVLSSLFALSSRSLIPFFPSLSSSSFSSVNLPSFCLSSVKKRNRLILLFTSPYGQPGIYQVTLFVSLSSNILLQLIQEVKGEKGFNFLDLKSITCDWTPSSVHDCLLPSPLLLFLVLSFPFFLLCCFLVHRQN